VPTAVIFPGQGSQFVGMADPWATHPASLEVLEEASKALGTDVVELCRDEAALATTEFVQPALLACDVAAFRVLEATGIRFEATAGHSLGEFAALVAAAAMTLEDALTVVRVRGRAMQAAAQASAGTMAAIIGASAHDGAAICDAVRNGDELVVANENSPRQVVLSGSVPAVERAEAEARSRGFRAVRLSVAGAFHSALMKPAAQAIREALDQVPLRDPRFPVVANVTGGLVVQAHVERALLDRHVISPVRWERSIRTLAETGFATFVEAGPGDVLAKLVRRIHDGARGVSIGSPAAALDLATDLRAELSP